ncbi:Protein TAB2, chloroplastic [Zea mays]|uniref:Protein TAB2 homolog, chloroplastic n=2 Tax=Zea mays TaxID=4577 RepID=ATAB2_MAIZE|nr:protein TAB2 homolog, chloroplastic [Zea mays]B4FTR7.1 RecName: Full=Protein TAB2 homolog, chloroplastic; Short=Zm-TAB2; Flags: Precursor [Zea mays]ACF85510.1 unknown [Zea mays]ACG40656.1 tab2 protein [Zea mays]AQK72533.1 translation chloroplast psaB mRNA2-like protein [Zea mays]PWZ24068.1 Protein TAB2, chloroplastic [Zea mays]|eukprot:NP_001150851.1 protein TAB2 homolog, chloroplastic [Zea mays]
MTTATAIVAGHGLALRRSLPLPNPPGRATTSVSLSARPVTPARRMIVPASPSPRSPRRCRSISSESSTEASAAADIADEEVEAENKVDPQAEVCYLDPDVDPESIREWELDFCSRPILDARGKKVWELVVCDATLSLQFTRYFPNNAINSVTLRDALASVSEALGVPMPDRVRFFRSQMQTIITRACGDLGVKAVPSRRCVSLLLWLEERYEVVYSRHPGFQAGTRPLLALDNPFPTTLPENLFGDKWAFVQLPFSAVREEVESLERRYAFGAGLDLELLGFELDDTTLVPGVAVESSRAKPLAAWMNGLEICAMEADTGRASLILSAGVSTRYVYSGYQKTAASTQEAEAWEAAKKACGGLHFLAIQENLNSDGCVGFWLLLDLPPPPV